MGLRPTRLRTRITLVASGVTLVMMSLAAVAMLLAQERDLQRAVDAALQESVDEISRELDVVFDRPDRRPEAGRDPADGIVARVRTSGRQLQLIAGNGDLIAASRPIEGEPALIDPRDVLDEPSERSGEFATVDGSGSRYRVAATALDGDRVLLVAYSLADVDESLAAQRRILVVVIPVLSGLVGLLIWLVLGRALTPVEAMRREVAAIDGRGIDRRVPVPERSVELAALATTMNGMLQRIDDAVAEQNRFVADAAHELRSPLAGIRGQLEVNVHHPEAPDRVESEHQMLDEAIRMQDLVDDLLLLARADSGRLDAAHTDVDLDDIVFDEADRLRRTSDLAVGVEAVSAAQVRGDRGQLQRVVRNLVDNARRHAATRVSLALHEEGVEVVLAVADDGPGVPADRAESVFGRFTRLDESRRRDAGGSGLGLAISREIVEHHGGTIALDTTHRPGARFVVRLPTHDA